jgi:hypothetical protein
MMDTTTHSNIASGLATRYKTERINGHERVIVEQFKPLNQIRSEYWKTKDSEGRLIPSDVLFGYLCAASSMSNATELDMEILLNIALMVRASAQLSHDD